VRFGVGLDALEIKVSCDCRESARSLVAIPTEPLFRCAPYFFFGGVGGVRYTACKIKLIR